jgi:hypothetical protein
MSSTAAQFAGDTLLKYITSVQYPVSCCGICHAFVLNWKEQVMNYKKLAMEIVSPKQKRHMLQINVSVVSDLFNVK